MPVDTHVHAGFATDHARPLARLASVPVLTLTLILVYACLAPGNRLRTVSAQSISPSGSFGFLINTSINPASNDRGTVVLGVMNFDGAGNVSGPYTFQLGASDTQAAQTIAGTFTGTYSSTPDGTGSVTIALDVGLTAKFAVAITDGGQGLQLVGTHLDGGDIGGIVINGVARAAHPGSLQGSYGFQLNNSPIPACTVGFTTFDGAGNVTVSFVSVGVGRDASQPPVSSGTVTGTYSVNPDGSGTINLPAAGSFAFVVTDGGSGLLMILTNGTANNVSSGTARLR